MIMEREKRIGGKRAPGGRYENRKESVDIMIRSSRDVVGALTHSAPVLDISMKNLHPVF